MINIIKSEELLFDDVIKLIPKDIWNSPDYSDRCYDYYAQRPTDEGGTVRDCSFLISNEEEPLILFRGAISQFEGRTNLEFSGVPCAVFEFKRNWTGKTKKIFHNECNQIFEKINGTIWYRDFLIRGAISPLTTLLLKSGAKATPRLSQIIDLTEDKALLWKQIRKSYSSLINNGLRDMDPEIMDSKTITWQKMQEFRNLHIRESGRETRSEESWKRQFEMVKADEVFVIFGTFKNKLVTAGLFSYNKTNCLYWVSTSRRDLFNKPLFHAIMWTAILHAKELGCKWFEVGEQYFPNHPAETLPTKKELGISDFKAGFGSETRMFLDLKLDNSLDDAL